MSKVSVLLLACFIAVFLEISASPVPAGEGIYGDNFQGDIKLTDEQKRIIFGGEEIEGYTGMLNTAARWPMNLQRQVIVPYRIQNGFSPAQRTFLLEGMRLIEAATCIRFVVRTTQVDFLDIINAGGCWSWLGRVGGRQELSMGRNCFWGGTAEHEFIHALGYDHMHNSIDRNNFVTVNMGNVQAGTEHNFLVVNPNNFNNFGTPYDLRSVMHYPRWAFQRAANLDTVVPHDRSYIDTIGMGRISSGDLNRLNRMYQC